MSSDASRARWKHLHEGVVTFATPSFHLVEDLDELRRVLEVSADRAAVLVCGRVLEALAKSAVEACRLRVSANVYYNLETLQNYSQLPKAPAALAHGLRRLGNDARHVLRRLTSADAQIGAAVLEVWLGWYFVDFESGPSLAGLTSGGQRPGLCRSEGLADWMSELVGCYPDVTVIARRLLDDRDGKLALSPLLPSLVAESLIAKKQRELSAELLSAALSLHPRDLRLRQLEGLRMSRFGDLERARALLQEMRAEGLEDSETLGILGGILKRLWDATLERKYLDECFQCYRRVWKRSDEEDTYHGINVAMLSLVRGDSTSSRRAAARVKALLTASGRNPDSPAADYWDRATLAEATLLLGERAEADRLYAELERDFKVLRPGDLETTQKQRQKILEEFQRLSQFTIPSSSPAPLQPRQETR